MFVYHGWTFSKCIAIDGSPIDRDSISTAASWKACCCSETRWRRLPARCICRWGGKDGDPAGLDQSQGSAEPRSLYHFRHGVRKAVGVAASTTRLKFDHSSARSPCCSRVAASPAQNARASVLPTDRPVGLFLHVRGSASKTVYQSLANSDMPARTMQ